MHAILYNRKWHKLQCHSVAFTSPLSSRTKYSQYINKPIFISLFRWIVSPSSFRVTESCTDRHQGFRHQDHGRPRTWRFHLSAVSSSHHSRRELFMKSKFGPTSMSSKAWTVNPGQHELLKRVRRSNNVRWSQSKVAKFPNSSQLSVFLFSKCKIKCERTCIWLSELHRVCWFSLFGRDVANLLLKHHSLHRPEL